MTGGPEGSHGGPYNYEGFSSTCSMKICVRGGRLITRWSGKMRGRKPCELLEKGNNRAMKTDKTWPSSWLRRERERTRKDRSGVDMQETGKSNLIVGNGHWWVH